MTSEIPRNFSRLNGGPWLKDETFVLQGCWVILGALAVMAVFLTLFAVVPVPPARLGGPPPADIHLMLAIPPGVAFLALVLTPIWMAGVGTELSRVKTCPKCFRHVPRHAIRCHACGFDETEPA
jgi:hypothetical protein